MAIKHNIKQRRFQLSCYKCPHFHYATVCIQIGCINVFPSVWIHETGLGTVATPVHRSIMYISCLKHLRGLCKWGGGVRIKLGLVPLERGVGFLMVSAAAAPTAVSCCPVRPTDGALVLSLPPALRAWRFSISRVERWSGSAIRGSNIQTKAHVRLKTKRVYATETLDYVTEASPACFLL